MVVADIVDFVAVVVVVVVVVVDEAAKVAAVTGLDVAVIDAFVDDAWAWSW